jgi:hypothetical protein
MKYLKGKLKSKEGNIAIYIVVVAIVVAILFTMGMAFSSNAKSSVKKTFDNENSGFDYRSQNNKRVN